MKLNKTKYSFAQLSKWLWQHHRGCRLQATLNAVIGVLLVAVGLAGVDTLRVLTDIATGNRPGSLLAYSALFGILILIEITLSVSNTWISNVLGVKAQNVMQSQFFSRLLHSQWRGMERYHSGDVLNRLFSDVSDIISLMTQVVPSVLVVTVQFVASFAYMYALDSRLAIALILISPLFILLSRLYFRRMRKIVRHVKDSNSTLQAIIQESVQHRMVIKTLGRTDDMISRLCRRQDLLAVQVKARARFSVISRIFINIAFSGAYFVVMIWGLYELQAGLITMGMLMAIIQLINRIQRPMLEMARLLPTFINSMTSCERLMELEELPVEDTSLSPQFSGAIGLRFSNVSFAYPPEKGRSGRQVICSFSHDFAPGSFTAILGETGAGKTTLMRMMLALIEPNSGTLEAYDNCGSYPLSTYIRRHISYVPQGNTLFSGSIRDNLLMGNPNATSAEMRQALHDAKADFVFDLPFGLDAQCTEQGGGLSEGQAQRLAIARALLHPCSLLVLDEATSALDPATERAILETVKTKYSDRTVIFVTHRLAVTEYVTETITINRE